MNELLKAMLVLKTSSQTRKHRSWHAKPFGEYYGLSPQASHMIPKLCTVKTYVLSMFFFLINSPLELLLLVLRNPQ